MPWIDSPAQQRLRFVLAAQVSTLSFTALCQQFSISRPTGYKWLARYVAADPSALQNRSRRPLNHPQQHPGLWRKRVFTLRQLHPTWGAKKLWWTLRRLHPRARRCPARRTIDQWLRLAGFSVKAPPRQRPGLCVARPLLTPARHCNHVWTLDFKGWFRTGDGTRCDFLTVRDLASRFTLGIRLVPKLSEVAVRCVLRKIFARHGLPRVIRVDNGAPFAGSGSRQLTFLSVWWLRLGIRVEFTRPASPQDNGSHEQMHRILKAETAAPPAPTPNAQQRRCDRWRHIYNHLRHHEALCGRLPASLYRSSPRPLHIPAPSLYRAHWLVRRVRSNGWIKLHGRLRFIGRAFIGQSVGLKPIDPNLSEVYLDRLLLGTLLRSDRGGSLRAVAYAAKTPFPQKV